MLDRRTLLKLSAALPGLISTAADSARLRRNQGGAQRPNFLQICADDMRFSDIKVMANVRRMVRDPGVMFTKNFVPFPLCAPSRVGLLTGLQPHNHGVLKNKGDDGGYAAYRALEGNSLPVWLTNAGYHVGHVGKFINEYDVVAPHHVPPGYSDWRVMSCDFTKYTDFTLNENGTQIVYNSGEYTTDIFLEKVLNFIATAPQPFALFFWPNCCHWPAVPASEDVGTFQHVDMPIYPSFDEADVSDKPRFVRRLQQFSAEQIATIQDRWRVRSECLQSLDRAVAAIVHTLETSGLIGNTHVMFTSDNGFIEGEHRIDNGKNYLYEECARTELYWRQPSGYADACRQPVSNIDTTATMVDFSGAEAGRVLDGKSLAPLLADVSAGWSSATLLQSGMSVGIATSDYRYIHWVHQGDIELYDMTGDPFQLNNVAGKPEYKHIEHACAQALQSLLACSGDTCTWIGEFPPPPG